MVNPVKLCADHTTIPFKALKHSNPIKMRENILDTNSNFTVHVQENSMEEQIWVLRVPKSGRITVLADDIEVAGSDSDL